MRAPLVAATLLGLMALAIGLQVARERWYGQPGGAAETVLYFRSGEALGKIALGYDTLLADVYWIRAVQHFGRQRGGGVSAAEGGFSLLYPLLDITTTLDPRFNIAYRFGAIFLSEPMPGGPGRPDLAIKLLEKGIRVMPDRWRYYQDVAFVHYWWLQDYRAAAEWFDKGAQVPGAPWWMRSLAALTLAKGGDRQRSRLLWQHLRDSADNDWLRENAQLRLTQLQALDQIDYLQGLVARYEREQGRRPRSWADLRAAGLIPGTPTDPAGDVYLLDSDTGAVRVSPTSPLSPMPVEPGAVGSSAAPHA
jgi:tetratricopeptide (TPR) repeat protein